jgi:hypothetical protein
MNLKALESRLRRNAAELLGVDFRLQQYNARELLPVRLEIVGRRVRLQLIRLDSIE